ncbi:MAG: hypothetical protein IPK74_21635 [Deltaproteobacteria bacterium]|nr:hypothetical protein [Deltaproteobacteria bacterium]
MGLIFTWCAGTLLPTPAQAHGVGVAAAPFAMMAKKKKKPKAAVEESSDPALSSAEADTKRQAIRDSVQAERDAGNMGNVADGLQRNAEELGDPITMLEAGEARLDVAQKDRDTEAAEAAIATTRIALDILHFYAAVDAGQVTSDWQVISPSDASGLIDKADAQIERAQALIEEIEAEKTAASEVASGGAGKKKKKKKREKGDAKPGTGLIAAGSIFTAVGVGGASIAIAGLAISSSKQKEVEKHMPGDPEVDELDKAGKRANVLGFVGVGVAVVGLAVGLPLIVVGAKKRKAADGGVPSTAYRHDRERAYMTIVPAIGQTSQGLLLQGRF